jgi:hypothetical protein
MPHSGYLFVVERKEPGKMPHSGYLLCTLKDVTLAGNVKSDFPGAVRGIDHAQLSAVRQKNVKTDLNI